ncbi:hypothetical protein EOM39_05565 [Candidatus Gracilibacteria bacterium]|nr:hypothetical protein [Candidatus Gracilibacteria bacterium]
MEIICKIIFYLSYTPLIFLGYFFYRLQKYGVSDNKIYIFYLVLSLIFIYSRFIETHIIRTQYNKIDVSIKAKIVVLSDLHLGIFKDERYLARVVKKVNKIENIDFVIIPGDSIYYAKKSDLDKLFKPLSQINKPIFITLGSHDFEPKDITKDDLINLFKKHNLILLDNQSYKLDKLNLSLLGLGDNDMYDDEIELINNFKKEDNLLVIAHNPDTVSGYKNNDIPKLTISGHTHGGQIRLPFIYKHVIPCEGDFDQGLYNQNGNKLFISSGLGEVLLSMRLFIPPVIDVLELR